MSLLPPKLPLLIVLGATGTGKSQLAIDLALRFNGEIINGDAMQLYNGLPILTNKVTSSGMCGIPHHLLGEIGLQEETMRVGTFKKRASAVMKGIRERGKLPILVGGTHYYTQIMVFGDILVEEGERENKELSFEEIAKRWPILEGETGDMLDMLREVDPVMAERWHPKDRRKIRRSLEIYLMSGKKASEIYAAQYFRKATKNIIASEPEKESELESEPSNEAVDLSSTLFFWVHAESSILKARLDTRVEKMLQSGMIDEIKSMDQFLRDQEESTGQTIDRTRGIWVSIGYKEFEPYLQALKSPTSTETELKSAFNLSVEQTQAATRQYAKSQKRWICLKLLPALAEENALKQLYLLDGSNIEEWEKNVSGPAIEITEDFLAGRDMKDPIDVCEAAKEILGNEEIGEGKKEGKRRECEVCGVVTVVEEQWERHLKSRRHRGAVKKAGKREMDRRRIGDEGEGVEGGEGSEGRP